MKPLAELVTSAPSARVRTFEKEKKERKQNEIEFILKVTRMEANKY